MCDCERALELLSLELDGQLTPEEKGELEAHLAGCGECRRAAEELRQLHTILPELEEEVPDGLHQAIMDRIGAEKVVPLSGARKKRAIRQWASLAAVFAVILLGAGAMRTFLEGGGSGGTTDPMAGAPASTAFYQEAGGEAGAADPEEAATQETPVPAPAMETYDGGGDSPAEEAQPEYGVEAESGESGGVRMMPAEQPQPSGTPVAEGGTADKEDNVQAQVSVFDMTPEEDASAQQTEPDAQTVEVLTANCAAWLEGSSFEQKDRVDATLAAVARVTQEELAAAVCDSAGQQALLDDTDWAVTLGDTSGHDFAILLCDSETLAVLGYVPIA